VKVKVKVKVTRFRKLQWKGTDGRKAIALLYVLTANC